MTLFLASGSVYQFLVSFFKRRKTYLPQHSSNTLAVKGVPTGMEQGAGSGAQLFPTFCSWCGALSRGALSRT